MSIPSAIKAAIADPTTTEIDASNRGFIDGDVEELVALLKDKVRITSLNLFRNNFGDKGIASLAKLPHLKKLNLGQNDMSDEGAECLAKTLPSLEALDASHNNLTDRGIAALRTRRLAALDVSANHSVSSVMPAATRILTQSYRISGDYAPTGAVVAVNKAQPQTGDLSFFAVKSEHNVPSSYTTKLSGRRGLCPKKINLKKNQQK